ncbi:ParB/RepB/Spo0J family partition protein [Verrucomicrobiota bacterium]
MLDKKRKRQGDKVMKYGLGRGLGALLKDDTVAVKPPKQEKGQVIRIAIGKIEKNPVQPRHSFDKETISELAKSIKEHGVIQPLLVRMQGERYQLVAGERRLRAAKSAGLTEIPAIIIDAPDNEALELALIENLQREDLNVLEEAEGYQMLGKKFGLTQEQIAERVGKARASITNITRLLTLPDEIKQLVINGQLSAGHAKVLTGLEIREEQILYAKKAVKENLSVRNLEKTVERIRRAPRKPRAQRYDMPVNHVTHLSDKLHKHFGTSVRISPSKTYANGKKGKGSIEIDFFSNEDLDRILELLGISGE